VPQRLPPHTQLGIHPIRCVALTSVVLCIAGRRARCAAVLLATTSLSLRLHSRTPSPDGLARQAHRLRFGLQDARLVNRLVGMRRAQHGAPCFVAVLHKLLQSNLVFVRQCPAQLHRAAGTPGVWALWRLARGRVVAVELAATEQAHVNATRAAVIVHVADGSGAARARHALVMELREWHLQR
jgi:hypothetical protein